MESAHVGGAGGRRPRSHRVRVTRASEATQPCEPIEPTEPGEWSGGAAVDRDDIFGVRRAMELLPEDRWDAFLHRWAQLGDRCEYDLTLLRADVLQEAEECGDGALATAWSTIALAMSTYLDWRSGAA
jgi:hypothetical protein